MAPFDASGPYDPPNQEMHVRAIVLRDLRSLAEHYLRNRRPAESFALLSFLDEIGVADRRVKKMFLVAAIETKSWEAARRLLPELAMSKQALTEDESRILQYYARRVNPPEESGARS